MWSYPSTITPLLPELMPIKISLMTESLHRAIIKTLCNFEKHKINS